MLDYNTFFPYAKPRKEQRRAIEFAIEAIEKSDKRFVIIEAGTGVGKSAIGLTLSRYLEQAVPNKEDRRISWMQKNQPSNP